MRIAEYKDGKMIYRDATPEEVADFESQHAETPPTPEERIAALESALTALLEGETK